MERSERRHRLVGTFGREHPSILPETTVEIVYCLTFCLNSLWYTPVIDESGRLDKDLKAHYERFIVENKASVHHMLVSGCYDLWKKNNFTFNNTILSYLDAHTVDTCILRERIGLTQK